MKNRAELADGPILYMKSQDVGVYSTCSSRPLLSLLYQWLAVGSGRPETNKVTLSNFGGVCFIASLGGAR